LYRDENVPLLTEQTKLAQEYQQTCGAMTVEFDGQERTMQQMAVYAEEVDRGLRQRAWEAATARRLQDRERIEDLFDALFELRAKMAANADLTDFRAYAFRAYQRFDYTPEDCLRFHDAIERTAVPAAREMNARRRRNLGVGTLRPWDLAVDEKGRERLKPFDTVEELCSACGQVFERIDPELGGQFREMKKNGYLDLGSRKGKAPGGYQSTYDESRHPFIFMNAVGLHGDVRTLLHEGGHSFHAYATREEPLLEYRSSPIEFAEVASMAMELLALEHYDVIYAGEDLARARREQLEHIIKFFPWMAIIDGFQHWLYTHPDHDRDERRARWLELHDQFGTDVEFSGHEEARAYLWQRQLHLFEVPFYYVEYGIAQLGALQVWLNARRDRAGAVSQYRQALSLGGSRPLPELFEAAGARLDFSYETIAPLIEAVQEDLAGLEG
jgi:oligoendopeptidase F